MLLPGPLHPGRLIRRYKRFLADVELDDGRAVTAHCADPGSMRSVAEPGRRVLLADYSQHPGRKLSFGLELIHSGRAWIHVHPARANAIFAEAFERGRVPEFPSSPKSGGSRLLLEREVPVARLHEQASATAGQIAGQISSAGSTNAARPASRLDFVLRGDSVMNTVALEIKSVTLLRENGDCAFPDAASKRGRRHLEELISLREAGYRAAAGYLIQRGDGRRLYFANDIDPGYARLARVAEQVGVEFYAWRTRIVLRGQRASISLSRAAPIHPQVSRWHS